MELQEQIDLLYAAQTGKKLEGQNKSSFQAPWWPVVNTQNMNFSANNYRIKREPRVIYVNEYETYTSGGYPNADFARSLSVDNAVRTAVKYIEVIE